MLNVDEVNNCLIFDCPEEGGIELIFPVGGDGSNMRASIFVNDEDAQKLINIIQNKLNARL
ncbi:hypothetical protein LCGC14_2019380 [marine sediment metagenome]|uniref:Uncharacterized protein n=1 Tax=marine sediment metagenome TaxID=412755 RepID=A0A0F9EY09_9ZZZZ